MITYSIIKKSQLDQERRLNPHSYQPQSFIDFTKGSWIPIGRILEFSGYGTPSDPAGGEKGYRLITGECIADASVFAHHAGRADITAETLRAFGLKKNDILITRSAPQSPRGISGIYAGEEEAVYDAGLIRIRIRGADISPEYANIFLNCAYAWRQINTGASDNAGIAIGKQDIQRIKIPVIGREEQEVLAWFLKESWDIFSLASFLYSQAEKILSDETGLATAVVRSPVSAAVPLSRVKDARRMDPSYFQSPYQDIAQRISSYGAMPMAEAADMVPADFAPEGTAPSSFHIVEKAHINAAMGIIEGFRPMTGDQLAGSAYRLIRTGDIIIWPEERGRSQAAIAGKESQGHLTSGACIQLRAKKMLPEVLFVLARSPLMQSQWHDSLTGPGNADRTRATGWTDMVVPALPQPVQDHIAGLVRQAQEAAYKAAAIIEGAKRTAEQIIETSLQ